MKAEEGERKGKKGEANHYSRKGKRSEKMIRKGYKQWEKREEGREKERGRNDI